MSEEKFLEIAHIQARDNARTPVQWSSEENAGFSEVRPWLRVNPNFKEVNLSASEEIFDYYRRLIRFRKDHQDLVYGDLHDLDPEHETVFYYSRGAYRILLNMSDEQLPAYKLDLTDRKVLVSNYREQNCSGESFDLRPWEAVVFGPETH